MKQRIRDYNVRSIIDDIVLRVSDFGERDLRALITERTMEHLTALNEQLSPLAEAEIDRLASAIVKGVLKRLEQIAVGGGQIGTA